MLAFRSRAMTPDAPVVRHSPEPRCVLPGREAANPFYLAVPGIVQEVMDRFGERTGRHYGLVEYVGAPDAERAWC